MRTPALLLLAGLLAACPGSSSPGPDAASFDGSAGSGDSGAPGLDAASGAADASSDRGDAGLHAHLALTLHREAKGAAFVAQVAATGDDGKPLSGLSVEVVAGSQSLAAADLGDGRYEATVVPAIESGELQVGAHVAGEAGGPSRTALVLPTVADGWDQPEVVGGLVNTAGTEDSSTVSPDGEWLVVGTYVVVDIMSCLMGLGTGPKDGRNSACQTAVGPYGPPARPRMPGAERITSPTSIVMNGPKLCVTAPDGGQFELPGDGGVTVFALPPTTAYGFHRQADGTFAEPFVIHYDDDGWTSAPFCFSFTSVPAAGLAPVIYGYVRADQYGAPHQPTAATLKLGEDNVLGTYRCVGGAVQFSSPGTKVLPVGPATQNAGNTWAGQGYLWSDDESVNPAVVLQAKQGPDGGFGDWAPLAIPEAGEDLRQPVVFGGRVYYYRNAAVASVSWTGADPGERTSFGASVTELAGEAVADLATAKPGTVFGMGQPTFATRPDGSVEMYFVYYAKTATGIDGQVGVVRAR